MNILIYFSNSRPHPAITATLLDFLCRIIHNFYPVEQEKVRNGIYSSLRQIVDKRVLPSLSPLFDNPRLDKELRTMLKERFGVFLSKEEEDRSDPGPVIDRDDTFGAPPEPGAPTFSDDEDDDIKEEPVVVKSENNSLVTGKAAQSILDAAPSFGGSRTHDYSHLLESKGGGGDTKKMNSKRNNINHITANGESEELEQEIITKLEELRAETNVERRCEIMDQMIQLCISVDLSQEGAQKVAGQLSEILKDHFEGRIFPENPTSDSIEDSVGRPLFVMFRTLCEISESNPAR